MTNRRWLIPEQIQSSMMDCGPVALSSLMAGFGLSVNYARLREACQTDIDGTSINVLEEVACQLGLQAQQLLAPAEHVLMPAALPALVVVRQPGGFTHFVVVWRRHGRWLQVMDPGRGRVWLPEQQILQELYQHHFQLPAQDWLAWAKSEGFMKPLQQRMEKIGVTRLIAQGLITWAINQDHWQSLAALDAGVRMIEALRRRNALSASQTGSVLQHLIDQQQKNPDHSLIPSRYWRCQRAKYVDDNEQITFTGAVVLQAHGTTEAAADLPPDLARALQQKEMSSDRLLYRYLISAVPWAFPTLVLGSMLLGVVLILELALIKMLSEQGSALSFGWIGQGFLLLLLFAGLELSVLYSSHYWGRCFEINLRRHLFEKIPRLGDRYFHSRLTSDLAQRAWELKSARHLPQLVADFFQALSGLLCASVGLLWVMPSAWGLVFLGLLTSIAIPLLAHNRVKELDLRQRAYTGTLSRFYYDALLGLSAVRSHSAEDALRGQQLGLVTDWCREGLALGRLRVGLAMVQSSLQYLFVIGLVWHSIDQPNSWSNLLIVAYWGMQIPRASEQLLTISWQYPAMRNRIHRLLEPLTAPEEMSPMTQKTDNERSLSHVQLAFKGVSVHAAGKTLLHNVSLALDQSSHIAVVGPSGAGKSTLAGVLLGWHQPSAGQVTLNHQPLTEQIPQLRRQTAWVDPGVHLWNRSLRANVQYGNPPLTNSQWQRIVQQADLLPVINRLGKASMPLGEGGKLLSGGEGQRVRLARAMAKKSSQLVILDEPFRGLDKAQRQKLLAGVRSFWQEQSILFISHDISDTQSFPQVIVMENGTIVEQGVPVDLLKSNSRYRQLLHADQQLQKSYWRHHSWRNWWLNKAKLTSR